MDDLRKVKKQMRKKYAAIRDSLKLEAENKSRLIAKNLFATDEYINCDTILTYLNMRSEVITTEIIKDALNNGKKVGLPYILDMTNGIMAFIQVDEPEEPVHNEEKILTPGINTIILVPGLAFSKDGYRVGYGGGFYDRLLFKKTHLASIGLCFEAQLAADIPTNEFDMKVDYIITEKGVIQCKA